MTRYRKVEVGTWHDRKFRELTPAPPSGQTLWLYLLTGQRTTVFPGLVIATIPVLADDLKWPVDATRDCWKEIEDREMATADLGAGVIVLPKALLDRRNVPRETSAPNSPNVLRGWRKAWGDVPECALKDRYLALLAAFAKALGKAYEAAFVEAFGDVMPHGQVEHPSEPPHSLPRPARARPRGPAPDPVPAPGVRTDPSTPPPGQPPTAGGADRDQGPVAFHERAAAPVAQHVAPGSVIGDPDVRARQRLVERFRARIAEARRKAAGKHLMTGVRFDITLHGGENETELRQRLKDAGPNAESELEHVLAVAEAEALARPEAMQWLGWNLGRSRSWDRALRTPLEHAGGGKKSVFDVVDETVARLERDHEDDPQ